MLVLKVRSSSSESTSAMPLTVIWWAALFTRTSILPNSSTAVCTTFWHWASSLMSPGTLTALLPASSTTCAVSSASGSSSERRSEEHTSELQSRQYLVCRLLLEKKTTPLHPVLAL